MDSIVDFLFEMGMLAKTPRSGFFFLGSGKQSVAEHLNRTAYVGYVLAEMATDADSSKVLHMCLFHDVTEARISDLNHVHQRYTTRHEENATKDMLSKLPFGEKLSILLHEYEQRTSKEALLAKDADHIELLLCLKEELDNGSERAAKWIPDIVDRIQTTEGKQLANAVVKTQADRWWFGETKEAAE